VPPSPSRIVNCATVTKQCAQTLSSSSASGPTGICTTGQQGCGCTTARLLGEGRPRRIAAANSKPSSYCPAGAGEACDPDRVAGVGHASDEGGAGGVGGAASTSSAAAGAACGGCPAHAPASRRPSSTCRLLRHPPDPDGAATPSGCSHNSTAFVGHEAALCAAVELWAPRSTTAR
jgi:hypothetical protein